MTEEQFKQLQATFPWTTRVIPTGAGGLVQVINRHGQEVPLFTMTDLLEVLTRKLELKEPPSA